MFFLHVCVCGFFVRCFLMANILENKMASCCVFMATQIIFNHVFFKKHLKSIKKNHFFQRIKSILNNFVVLHQCCCCCLWLEDGERKREKGAEPRSLLQTHTNIDRAPLSAAAPLLLPPSPLPQDASFPPRGKHRERRQTSSTISSRHTHTQRLLKHCNTPHREKQANLKHPQTHFLLLVFPPVISSCVSLVFPASGIKRTSCSVGEGAEAVFPTAALRLAPPPPGVRGRGSATLLFH